MRLPEVTDRIVNVPVRALRAVFAGVGQLLLATDRLKDESRDAGQPIDDEPGADRSMGDEPDANVAADRTPVQSRRRSLESTGNVRLLASKDLAQAPADTAAQVLPEVSAEVSAAGLPLPGYDGLSVPSLRARLRNLDAAQLGILIEYEKANASREQVVTMFERRIGKLGSGAPDAA
jgi:hypothetical protein